MQKYLGGEGGRRRINGSHTQKWYQLLDVFPNAFNGLVPTNPAQKGEAKSFSCILVERRPAL